MKNAMTRARKQMLHLMSLALDALVAQGVEVSPEQYKRALIEAGRRAAGLVEAQTPEPYRSARDKAIALFLKEEEETP